jgi:hypothetical protein
MAKGTLLPADLSYPAAGIAYIGDNERRAGFDLILPTSAFKGRKGETAITPGDGVVDLWVGVQKLAARGIHRLGTQVLVNYPEAVRFDVATIVREELAVLEKAIADPMEAARYWLEREEKRLKFLGESGVEGGREEISEIDRLFGNFDGEDDIKGEAAPDPVLYRVVKAMVEADNPIVLEAPFVHESIRESLRKRYLDLATGRGVEFSSAMALPGNDLAPDEICVPHLPDGEEIIVTRSPKINSNGTIILKNRHLPSAKQYQGAVWLPPKTFARELQGDFDGDRPAYALASDFPTLTREIKKALLPENRYPDIVKPEKVKYEGTIEEIAIDCARNDIGKIANYIQRALALRWETVLAPQGERGTLAREAAGYYKNLLEKPPKNFEVTDLERYDPDISFLAKLGDRASLSRAEVAEAMARVQRIQFKVVADLGNQLQIAVDGPKSAARPDDRLVRAAEIASRYREVPWLNEKKDPEVYSKRPMETGGYDPISELIRLVNTTWKGLAADSFPAFRYREVFGVPEPDGDLDARAIDICNTYGALVGEARAIERSLEKDRFLTRPHLAVTLVNGEEIAISRLANGIDPKEIAALSPKRLTVFETKNPRERYIVTLDGAKIGVVSPAHHDALERPTMIAAGSGDPLGAALALETKGDIPRPVTIDGKKYPTAMAAFRALTKSSAKRSEKIETLQRIQTEKLTQHPDLRGAIEEQGGVEWLLSTRVTGNGNTIPGFNLAGYGERSPIVTATIEAYRAVSKGKERAGERFGSLTLEEALWQEYGKARVLPLAKIEARGGLNESVPMENRERAREILASALRGAQNPDDLALRLWHATFTTVGGEFDGRKRGSVAYNFHPDWVERSVRSRDIPTFRVTGVSRNELKNATWDGETVTIAVCEETDPASPIFGDRTVYVNGKKLGVINKSGSIESWPGLNGMTATAMVEPIAPGSIVVQSGDSEWKIGEVKKYDFAWRVWSGEAIDIEVRLAGRNNEAALAFHNGRVLGKFDKESYLTLKESGIVSLKGAIARSGDVTTVRVHVDPATVVYGDPGLEREERERYRQNLRLRELKPVNESDALPMSQYLVLNGQRPTRGVTTTADAMRYLGRCHTTRTYSPMKAHGLQTGDIALASDGKGALAFRVGKQYRITGEMVEDPGYRERWARMEKHHPDHLLELWEKAEENHRQRGGDLGPYLAGLEMEPLGEWDAANRRIVPFAGRAPAIDISPDSPDALGAALSFRTERAFESGKLSYPYPVSYRNNSKGEPFASAFAAYSVFSQGLKSQAEREALVADIVSHKLRQNRVLLLAIDERGGTRWLERCFLPVREKGNDPWVGRGRDSGFIRALIEGYEGAVAINRAMEGEKSLDRFLKVKYPEPVELSRASLEASDNSTDELARKLIRPIIDRYGEPVLLREPGDGRDLLLWAEEEFPFRVGDGDELIVGFPLDDLYEYANCHAPPGELKLDDPAGSIATGFIGPGAGDTWRAWARYHRANTGNYTRNDTILVAGEGKKGFEKNYRPLLDRGIQARCRFVFGDADRLAAEYLEGKGYKSEGDDRGFQVYSPSPAVDRESKIVALETTERDILKIDIGVIAHQVNCKGVFGASEPKPGSSNLATGIRHNPDWIKPGETDSIVYNAYCDKYELEGWKLGEVQVVLIARDLYVINVAGQDGYGGGGNHTDPDALCEGLEKAAAFARERNLPLYLPDGIGSGLGGGERDQIHDIVSSVCPEAILCKPPRRLEVVALRNSAKVVDPPVLMKSEESLAFGSGVSPNGAFRENNGASSPGEPKTTLGNEVLGLLERLARSGLTSETDRSLNSLSDAAIGWLAERSGMEVPNRLSLSWDNFKDTITNRAREIIYQEESPKASLEVAKTTLSKDFAEVKGRSEIVADASWRTSLAILSVESLPPSLKDGLIRELGEPARESPDILQRQRTEIVAPIIWDFLDFRGVDSYTSNPNEAGESYQIDRDPYLGSLTVRSAATGTYKLVCYDFCELPGDVELIGLGKPNLSEREVAYFCGTILPSLEREHQRYRERYLQIASGLPPDLDGFGRDVQVARALEGGAIDLDRALQQSPTYLNLPRSERADYLRSIRREAMDMETEMCETQLAL